MKKLFYILLVGLALSSCADIDESRPAGTVTLNLRAASFNNGSIGTGRDVLVNAANTQQISIDRMDLYLSNLAFYDDTQREWVEPASYKLYRLGSSGFATKGSATIRNVPFGSYSRIRLSFGVDSSHNHRLDQVGDLDPANGMAWDWVTGYRFLVMEGSVKDNVNPSQPLVWHIGSDANYRTRELILPFSLIVSQDKTSSLNLVLDLNRLFYGVHTLNPSLVPNMMFQPDTTGKGADNFVAALGIE